MSAAAIVATTLAFARQRAAEHATALRMVREHIAAAPPRLHRRSVELGVVLHDTLGFGLLVDTNSWQVCRLMDLCPGAARVWGFDTSGNLRIREDRTEYQCAGLEARPGCRDEVELFIDRDRDRMGVA